MCTMPFEPPKIRHTWNLQFDFRIGDRCDANRITGLVRAADTYLGNTVIALGEENTNRYIKFRD